MPSYKFHSLFAFIFALFIFPNNFLFVILAIIGANILDFDHDIKRKNVLNFGIIGALLFLTLYYFNLNYFLGLFFIILSIIFYISEHRSFTHSIMGILTLSALVTGIFISLFFTLSNLTLTNLDSLNTTVFNLNLTILTPYMIVSFLITLFFLLIIFLNKKLIFPIIISYILFLFYLPQFSGVQLFTNGLIPLKSLFLIFFSFLSGMFSHLILDSFTPQGVPAFKPFSNDYNKKIFGILGIAIWIFIIIFINLEHIFLYI